MEFKQCHRIKCKAVDYERFHNVTDTWIQRPQVVNRKLAGAVITKQFWIPRTKASEAAFLAVMGHDEETCSSQTNSDSSDDNVCCIVRKLLPRARHVDLVSEVIIKDDEIFSLTFLPLENCKRLFPYCLQFCPQTEELVLRWCIDAQQPHCLANVSFTDDLAPILEPLDSNHTEETTCGINIITLSWLVHILLPKLVSWAESWDEGRIKRESLIPLEDYVQLYHAMKKKYAAPLIEVSSLKIVGMWTQYLGK